jgi:hypothetical protein
LVFLLVSAVLCVAEAAVPPTKDGITGHVPLGFEDQTSLEAGISQCLEDATAVEVIPCMMFAHHMNYPA